MAVPYTFGSILGGASIPLSELDDNFSYLTTSPTFTGNVTINGILNVNNKESYFGVSNPAAYNGINIVNYSPTGYCSVSWVVGPAGANGYASVNYAPGIFLKFGVLGNDTTSPIVFVNNNDQERMRIAANGNVGIGTTSPVARLDVYNGSGASTSTVRAASGQNAFLSVIGNGNSFLSTSFDIIQDSTNTASIFQRANAPLLFGTNNTERVRIDSSGNLGIGTASPTDKLDVNSDAMRLRTAKTPASASDTGTQGQICWDSNYIYVCVATNTWKRASIGTW